MLFDQCKWPRACAVTEVLALRVINWVPEHSCLSARCVLASWLAVNRPFELCIVVRFLRRYDLRLRMGDVELPVDKTVWEWDHMSRQLADEGVLLPVYLEVQGGDLASREFVLYVQSPDPGDLTASMVDDSSYLAFATELRGAQKDESWDQRYLALEALKKELASIRTQLSRLSPSKDNELLAIAGLQPRSTGVLEDFCRSVVIHGFIRLLYKTSNLAELLLGGNPHQLPETHRNLRAWMQKLLKESKVLFNETTPDDEETLQSRWDRLKRDEEGWPSKNNKLQNDIKANANSLEKKTKFLHDLESKAEKSSKEEQQVMKERSKLDDLSKATRDLQAEAQGLQDKKDAFSARRQRLLDQGGELVVWWISETGSDLGRTSQIGS